MKKIEFVSIFSSETILPKEQLKMRLKKFDVC